MHTFKIYWKSGETELLMGSNIAEAFNLMGYTKDHIESMEKFCLVTLPDKEQLDQTLFSCKRCKATPVVEHLASSRWAVHCPDCNQNAHSKLIFENETDAKIDWNKKQFSNIQ